MNNDRNRKQQKKVGAGPNRPGTADGQVRAKAAGNHGSKREEKKSQSAAQKAPAGSKATPDEKLIEKARKWAALHADPHTRGAMDKVLNGLSPADQRRVVLCGQRIAAGMSIRLAK